MGKILGNTSKPATVSLGGSSKPATVQVGSKAKPATVQLGNVSKPATVQLGNVSKPATVQIGKVSKPATIQVGNIAKPTTVQVGNVAKPATVQIGNVAKPVQIQIGSQVKPQTIPKGNISTPNILKPKTELTQPTVKPVTPTKTQALSIAQMKEMLNDMTKERQITTVTPKTKPILKSAKIENIITETTKARQFTNVIKTPQQDKTTYERALEKYGNNATQISMSSYIKGNMDVPNIEIAKLFYPNATPLQLQNTQQTIQEAKNALMRAAKGGSGAQTEYDFGRMDVTMLLLKPDLVQKYGKTVKFDVESKDVKETPVQVVKQQVQTPLLKTSEFLKPMEEGSRTDLLIKEIKKQSLKDTQDRTINPKDIVGITSIELKNEKWAIPGLDKDSTVNKVLQWTQANLYDGAQKELVANGWIRQDEITFKTGNQNPTFQKQFGSQTAETQIEKLVITKTTPDGDKVIAQTIKDKQNGIVVSPQKDDLLYMNIGADKKISSDVIKTFAPSVLVRDINGWNAKQVTNALGKDGIDKLYSNKDVIKNIATYRKGQTVEKLNAIAQEVFSFNVTGNPIVDGALMIASGGVIGIEGKIAEKVGMKGIAELSKITGNVGKLTKEYNKINVALPMGKLSLGETLVSTSKQGNVLLVPNTGTIAKAIVTNTPIQEVTKIETKRIEVGERLAKTPTTPIVKQTLKPAEVKTQLAVTSLRNTLDKGMMNTKSAEEFVNKILTGDAKTTHAALVEFTATVPDQLYSVISKGVRNIEPDVATKMWGRLEESNTALKTISEDFVAKISTEAKGDPIAAGKALQRESNVLGRNTIENLVNTAQSQGSIYYNDMANAMDAWSKLDRDALLVMPEPKTNALVSDTTGRLKTPINTMISPKTMGSAQIRELEMIEKEVGTIQNLRDLTQTEIKSLSTKTKIPESYINKYKVDATNYLEKFKTKPSTGWISGKMDVQTLIDIVPVNEATLSKILTDTRALRKEGIETLMDMATIPSKDIKQLANKLNIDPERVATYKSNASKAIIWDEDEETIKEMVSLVEEEKRMKQKLEIPREQFKQWDTRQEQTLKNMGISTNETTGKPILDTRKINEMDDKLFAFINERDGDTIAMALKGMPVEDIVKANIRNDRKMALIRDYSDVLKMPIGRPLQETEKAARAIIPTPHVKQLTQGTTKPADATRNALVELRNGNYKGAAEKLAESKDFNAKSLLPGNNAKAYDDMSIAKLQRMTEHGAPKTLIDKMIKERSERALQVLATKGNDMKRAAFQISNGEINKLTDSELSNLWEKERSLALDAAHDITGGDNLLIKEITDRAIASGDKTRMEKLAEEMKQEKANCVKRGDCV